MYSTLHIRAVLLTFIVYDHVLNLNDIQISIQLYLLHDFYSHQHFFGEIPSWLLCLNTFKVRLLKKCSKLLFLGLYYVLFQESRGGGQRDNSEVKNIFCSCRGLKFGAQHLHEAAKNTPIIYLQEFQALFLVLKHLILHTHMQIHTNTHRFKKIRFSNESRGDNIPPGNVNSTTTKNKRLRNSMHVSFSLMSPKYTNAKLFGRFSFEKKMSLRKH